jgi:predicted enzyme related to lactoylglutathione lyase
MIRMMAAAAAMAAGLAGSALAADSPGAGGGITMLSVKIAVADFAKATAFYTKYFGMKQGTLYNPAEQGLDWANGSHGTNLILVHDPSGKIQLTPGTTWIMLKVPDAKKIAKAMTDDGVAGVEAPIEMAQYHTVIVMARDLDGNRIEMLQVGP